MAIFQMNNKKSLQQAVNKSISKNKKKEERQKPIENRQQQIQTRRSSTPINNITTSNLNVNQLKRNYEAASRVTQNAQNKLNSFLDARGGGTRLINPQDTLLKRNTKMTPIKGNENTSTPFNASQILQQKVQKRKELLNSDEGQELQNEIRVARNTRNIEQYNYNLKRLETDNTHVGDTTIGSLIRGFQSLFDNMGDSYKIEDDKGRTTKLASYADLKQEKVNKSNNLVGRLVSSTFNNLGKILGAGAIDTVTMGVGGKAIYWGDNFFDSYYNNINDGYDEGSSATSAMLTTMLGAVIDKTLGSAAVNAVGDVDATGLEDIISKALTKKGMGSNLAKYISSMTSEGASEFIEEYADAFIDKLALDKSADPKDYLDLILETFPAALESGVVGSLSGGIGTAKDNVGIKIDNKRKLKGLVEYKKTLEAIKPKTPEAAISKENMLIDVENQIAELQPKATSGETRVKQTNQQMEQTAKEALEKRKQEQRTAPNTTEQVETKTQEKQTDTLKKAVELGVFTEERARNMKISAAHEKKQAERLLKQGNSLERVEGGLTEKELLQVKEKLNKNYIGKEVLVDNKPGKIVSNTFGKIKVEFEDGTSKVVTKADIKNNPNVKIDINKMVFGNTYYNDMITQKTQPQIKSSTEQVQDANIQKNAPTEKQDATVQETKTNYNIPEAKNDDKLVAKLTEKATPEVKKQTEQLFAEPSKNKTSVEIGDGRTVTTPSETTREGGLEAASKYINDSVSQKEVKQIKTEDKKRRKSLENLYNMAMNMGDTERAAYIKEMRDNDLYTVEHSGYEVFKETMKMLEDPETYYKQYNDKINSTDNPTTQEITKLEYMQTALYKYYADYNSPSYNPTMANSIIQDWAEEGTSVAQALAARRQMYNDDPNHVAIRTQQTLNSLFREEAKNHEGDTDWLNKNDPLKNSDSPYHMTDTQLSTVNYYANELSKIKDKSSTEYLTTYSQLNNYIQSLFGDKKLTDKMKRLTITNVLASSRIWVQNIKGNFVNLAQFNGVDKLIASNVDRIISNQTQMRSVGMSFEGDVIEGLKAYKQGISDSWSEFKNDITLSKFHSKYTDSESTNMGDLGKKGFGKTFNDETKVGHALNRYQDFVNFALDLGDRPFAQMYYQQSIYNQRMLNAQIDAQASGKNTVYNVNFNEDTKMYRVRYFDENGQKINTNMTEEQYKTFSKTAVEEELTEKMCNIAEKEALENTYQDDNKITKAALKMKDSLNDLFHVGDFGFGDMILKFTRTGSNMAKALYEHSPLAAGQLIKDARALNRNIKTGTASIELQHKVAREAGKLLGGAVTMSIIGALDWAGIIDIEGEHDDKKGDKFKESTLGSQEFSVDLPGGEYSYKISNDSTIGSLARLGKTAEEFLKDGNSLLETLGNMTAPFTNEIIDNSFMSSILDLGSSYSDPLDNLARKIASQPSNLLPGFMKDVSIALDNFTQRNTYDENLGQYMINQIINKTPLRNSDIDFNTPIGNVKGLSSKKTAWGEIRSVGGDTLASFWNTFLTGDTLSKLKNDRISDEVVRVYTETNNTNAIPNLSNTKNFSYNNKKYDLSEQEQSKYMTTYGKTSYKAVRDLMNTNQYKNATDEQKVKLLDKAYDYAKEKATQDYIESKGKKYYNFNKKDKKYTEYKKPAFEEIIENDISIEEANYKRNHNNAYKLKTSITGLENYQNIAKDIKEIKDAYSTANGYDYKTRKYAIQSYINELSGLSSTQKAMLSKLENSKSDYSNYDDKILSYIKSLKLTDEEYQYMYKQLGLGGYWAMYYKTKKND